MRGEGEDPANDNDVKAILSVLSKITLHRRSEKFKAVMFSLIFPLKIVENIFSKLRTLLYSERSTEFNIYKQPTRRKLELPNLINNEHPKTVYLQAILCETRLVSEEVLKRMLCYNSEDLLIQENTLKIPNFSKYSWMERWNSVNYTHLSFSECRLISFALGMSCCLLYASDNVGSPSL